MNYCDSIHDDLEALASQKTFGELTPDERASVLRLLGSADAYTGLRSTVMMVRSELAADAPRLEPRAASRANLRAMVEQRGGHSQNVRTIPFADRCRAAVNRRIPVAYSAAAVIVAVAATLLLRPADQPSGTPKIVYIDRPVEVERVAAVQQVGAAEVEDNRVVDSSIRKAITHLPKGSEARSVGAVIRDTARETVAAVVKTVSTTLPGSTRSIFVGLGNLYQLEVQAKGRTLADDSSLSRFTRRVSLSEDTL